jgi:ABC-type multidrug transport system ATPase subunit
MNSPHFSELRIPQAVAEARNVTMTFDGYQSRALTEMSFDIRKGEILGILRWNGAGKSTVLRLLAGRLQPSEGKITVFGGRPQRGKVQSQIAYLSKVISKKNAPTAALFDFVSSVSRSRYHVRSQSALH